jgi:hypothetical protein
MAEITRPSPERLFQELAKMSILSDRIGKANFAEGTLLFLFSVSLFCFSFLFLFSVSLFGRASLLLQPSSCLGSSRSHNLMPLKQRLEDAQSTLVSLKTKSLALSSLTHILMPIQRNGHEPAGCFFDSTEREKERRRMGGGGHLRRRSRFRASHPRLVQSNLTHSMRQKIVSRTMISVAQARF